MSISGNWDSGKAGEMERLGSIDRRAFVKASGVTAAGLIFGVGPSVDRAMAAPRFRDYPFKLGVASGDPRPDGVVLWTRLAPNPLAESGRGGVPRQNIAVRWEVATDEGFRRIVRQGSEVARPELGHSVHAEVRGLAPKRPYFYRFKAGSETSPVGRTKTTPPFGAYTAKLSFAFASCQQYEHGYFGAFRRLAQEDLDLVVHLGDYIYEYGPNEYRAAGGNVRVHNSGEITTLAAYRNRHAQYRGDRDLQRAHAAHPWVVTWDDHEVENNYADEIPEQGQSPEAFLQRRANAYQAYYEHMPLRRSSVPRGPDMRLYRRLAYGNLAESTCSTLGSTATTRPTETGSRRRAPSPRIRTARSPATARSAGCSTAWPTWARAGTSSPSRCSSPSATSRTGLDNASAWTRGTAIRPRGSGSSTSSTAGGSRTRSCPGDVHANWANDILRDFEDPESEVVGAEFVGTSITSGGDGSDVRADTAATLAENPHIKFFNNQRGYVRCTLTPRQWRADYRVVPYVSQPGAPAFTRASFVVEAGNPGLQQVGEGQMSARTRRSSEVEADRLRAQGPSGRVRSGPPAGRRALRLPTVDPS